MKLSGLERFIPPRMRFIAWVFLINLFVYTLFRLAFLFYLKPADLDVFSTATLYSLYLGVKFDARLAALICLPLLFLSGLPGINIVKTRLARLLWRGYLILTSLAILFVYGFDFGAYSYIRTRVNASLLMFIDTPDIVTGMITQSYPLGWILLGFLLFLTAYYFILKRAESGLSRNAPSIGGWKKACAYVVMFFLLAGVIYGKFQRYPLRWSDAFVHRDEFVCLLALNPVLFFFDTLEEEPNNYEPTQARKYYPLVAENLGVSPDPDSLSLFRRGNPDQKIPDDCNVVLIFLETFAAFKVGAMGNPLDSSPHFDELADHGLLLKRFYVPMENTSRSLFAALFGIPDVSSRNSSSRNPLVVNQHTILNAFEGYEKQYFLGGSANWGNIRGMLAHNVDGLNIYEEGSYDSPAVDVWGISDADLFMEANHVLKSVTEAPFFAVIQTSGNHRPFTIPDDARGFECVERDPELLEQSGFYSLDEFNGFRFLDHCLGYFFDLARQEDYFSNTLFVILGDHGTKGGAVDRRYGDMALASVHVPLLLYAPGLLEAGVYEGVASELDLMPTIAGMMGKPYVNQTLGRDIFETGGEGGHAAFVFTPFRNPPRYGIIEGDFYAIQEPDGSGALYNLNNETEEDLQAMHPKTLDRLIGLSRGYYEMARYLLYHNPGTDP